MIKKNPFYILGITTRDNRQKIVEMAEDKSLELDEDVCQSAQSVLTTPSKRIDAELDWFPGISPGKVEKILSTLNVQSVDELDLYGLPPLPQVNILLEFLRNDKVIFSPNELKRVVEDIVNAFDSIDAYDVVRDINEDRSVAGFPSIENYDQIETLLDTKRRSVVKAIIDKVNDLETLDLIKVMTEIVDDETNNGEVQASQIIDDLVDDYKLHTQKFLEEEAEKINKMVDFIGKNASKSEKHISTSVDKLLAMTKTWDDVAQPIQLSTKARGLDDTLSKDLAYKIRSLGIDLFNKYDYVDSSKKITETLKVLFEELPDVHESLKNDIDVLNELLNEREQSKREREKMLRELSYSVDIGLIFSDTLSISASGISWKGKNYPLDSVTRATWGAVSHSVNGIPTGTTYTIAFGDARSVSRVETKKKEVFIEFTDRLWKAVGTRILTDMLKDLSKGQGLQFNRATIWNDGVTLYKSGWFSSDEKRKFSWGDITIWSQDGNFVIAARSDRGFSVQMPYLEVFNVHFLESAIRIMFKNPNVHTLSGIL